MHILFWVFSHLANRSILGKSPGFSCFVLVLISYQVYSANQLALQKAGTPSKGIGPLLCLSGLFFLVWGSKLDLINALRLEPSIQKGDQWGFEGSLYSFWFWKATPSSALMETVPTNEHRPLVLRLLLTMLLKLNGQWDPIVSLRL